MIYDFRQQLHQGQAGEHRLDQFFSEWYDIAPVGMEQQRQGVDRMFKRKDNGTTYKVEYKTDKTASSTGNAFVETVSVDTANKPGWAYSSQSDYLVYFLPEDLLIYVIAFDRLRSHLPQWAKCHRTRRIPNKGYHTVGLLVPLDEFEKIATQVISL